jgi:uncharacterized membrane protein YraQ (UPF0718 family)
MLNMFFSHFFHYFIEILPVLIVGFLLSGFFYEFVPTTIIERFLTGKGLKPIISLIFVGALLPICCFGSLPLAVTLHKRGVRLGPILAFLVATPATSISALLVTWRLLGIKFTVFIFLAVIFMGLIMGLIGNQLLYDQASEVPSTCPHCCQAPVVKTPTEKFLTRLKNILRFSFIELPKELGLLTLLGIFLAALVVTLTPIGELVKNYLGGAYSYLFAVIFGLVMYFCSTSSPPLVHALVGQGMNIGAGMTLLIIGPITSLGTILILAKTFGLKVIVTYLLMISLMGCGLGYLFSLL